MLPLYRRATGDSAVMTITYRRLIPRSISIHLLLSSGRPNDLFTNRESSLAGSDGSFMSRGIKRLSAETILANSFQQPCNDTHHNKACEEQHRVLG